MQSDAGIVVTS